MAKSKIIGVRIPDHLLREIENFGLTNFPKNESFDMTKSLLFLIQRGLQNEGIESPKSLSPSPSGDLDIDSNFKIHVLNDIENLKGLINDYQKQLKDNIDNLESQIDEFKESQIAINDRLYSKIENLETQSKQENKPLIEENKKEVKPDPSLIELGKRLKDNDFIFVSESYAKKHNLDQNKQYKITEKYFVDDDPLPNFSIADNINEITKEVRSARKINLKDIKPLEDQPPAVTDSVQKQPQPDHPQKPVNLSKFYPNQKIFKPYHIEQFKVIYDLLIGFDITFLSTYNSDVIQQWIVADQDGNKAGLYLNGASHWSLEKVNSGDGDLKGFFEDCNFNDNYLDDLLIANNIDLDEIAENYDQPDNDNLQSKTVTELRELAKSLKIVNPKQYRKDDLIKKIKEAKAKN